MMHDFAVSRWMIGLFAVLQTAFTCGNDQHWSFDSTDDARLTTHGELTTANGVEGSCLVFNGASLLAVKDSNTVTGNPDGFTITAWVNPYALSNEQQMIAARNVYSKNWRQWSLMIDKDNRFRLYLWQGKWLTVESAGSLRPGHWHHVCAVIRPDRAELWVNGRRANSVRLSQPVANTPAPLTFGGVNDNGRRWQNLVGALDDIHLLDRPLLDTEIHALYHPVAATHEIPESALRRQAQARASRISRQTEPLILWDESRQLPSAAKATLLKDVDFRVIKKWEPQRDGYRWLHGVALTWHRGRLYASFGHNRGDENTVTEEGRFCASNDAGKSWSDINTIDVGTESDDLAVSHGVFLSHDNTLWAFLGAFHGTRQHVHTRAYTLDESTGRWLPRGKVVGDGFWPMTEPVRMQDGNWIMSGFIVGQGNPAAVAISAGDDLTTWKRIIIPAEPHLGSMWGESSVIVDGRRLLNIARYGAKALALGATSDDFGRTWSPSIETNLPMATSKPCSGMLSTGQRYLVCTTTSDSGGRRSPLTITVSRPREPLFSKVFVIRHADFPDGPGESHGKAKLSYPCAVEHDGHLYVGYSNSGNRGSNQNSAELAIIPLSSLKVD